MFTKMVSMAHTPAEAKEEAKEMSVAPSVPKYPYGLCISLDDDSLKKLGLDGDLPAVGETMQFTAIARVTSASMHEREATDGGKAEQCCRVELQITDMGVPSDSVGQSIERSEARRKRFYGSMGDADAAE
jgi:hypothetical protein